MIIPTSDLYQMQSIIFFISVADRKLKSLLTITGGDIKQLLNHERIGEDRILPNKRCAIPCNPGQEKFFY